MSASLAPTVVLVNGAGLHTLTTVGLYLNESTLVLDNQMYSLGVAKTKSKQEHFVVSPACGNAITERLALVSIPTSAAQISLRFRSFEKINPSFTCRLLELLMI